MGFIFTIDSYFISGINDFIIPAILIVMLPGVIAAGIGYIMKRYIFFESQFPKQRESIKNIPVPKGKIPYFGKGLPPFLWS